MPRPFVRAFLASFTSSIIVLAARPARTQSGAPAPTSLVGARTPAALGALVLQRFATGTPEAFDSVYPDRFGREVVRRAVQQKATRRGDMSRAVWRDAHRAVILLGGTVVSESSEDDANRTRAFSGLYEAVDSGGRWTIARKLPIDSGNAIRAHTLHVTLTPGKGIRVTDTLALAVGSPYGFTVRLNGRARLSTVRLDGRAADYVFGGNVLWVRAAPRRRAQLVLTYTLDEERPEGGDSTQRGARSAAPAYGAYHNTFVWHPFFEYNSANDLAQLDITVRLPAAYHLTTSLPQTETVRDGVRTVHGRSQEPDFLGAIIYDRDWRPETTTVEGVRLESFLAPGFPYTHDSLAAELAPVYRLLSARFGPLASRYIAAVEDRAIGASGFRVRMNDAIVSGSRPRVLSDTAYVPTAAFAHEVSHAWTMNATGPAANFLREGWATYCEALALGMRYGPEAADALREISRAGYLSGPEGRQSILGDPDNGRLHYAKGVWIFSMLNTIMGDSAFDRGMRAYMRHLGGRAGYEELIAELSRAAGRDLHGFVMPWLTEKYIPDIRTEIDGQRVIFTQVQPGATFELPLDVELATAAGPVRRTVQLAHRADTVDVSDVGAVAAVRLDPDHHLLIQRHLGEVVRFAVHAPEAKSVTLLGPARPTPATRSGDDWVVELPLSEGRYFWAWQIDGHVDEPGTPGGDPSHYGVRVVRPLVPVPPAH